VQGGILATMLDEVMSPVVAAISRERVFTQTLEMKTSYLRGARPGTIFGEGRMLHRGQSIVFSARFRTEAHCGGNRYCSCRSGAGLMHRVCAPKLNTEELWGKGKSWLQTGIGPAEDTKRLAVTLSSALIIRHADQL
jgi:Thioesterase superfamily